MLFVKFQIPVKSSKSRVKHRLAVGGELWAMSRSDDHRKLFVRGRKTPPVIVINV